MPDYRAYLIGTDGHIANRVDFICADDETAKERAKLLSKSHDVELWQLDRKVAFITVDPSP
jgi:hypothetical protein